MPASSGRTLIHSVTTTKRVDVSGAFPRQQVSYIGKAANVVPIWPYGFDASVPKDKLGIGLSLWGNSDSKVALLTAMGDGEDNRIDLQEGEFALYHPPSGSKLHFKFDGSIEVKAGVSTILISPTIGVQITTPPGLPFIISGDAIITGSLTVGTTLDVTEEATIGTTLGVTGAATVGTTLGVTGATTLAAVTSSGKDIGSTHTHSGSATAPSGIVSDTGTPV